MPGFMGILKVAVEATARNGGINLVATREHGIGQRNARPSRLSWRRFCDAIAQFAQQNLEPMLFGMLRPIVSGPLLLVRLALNNCHSLRFGGRAVRIFRSLQLEFDREKMLALDAGFFMVRARAMRISRIGANGILALPRLRRD